MRPKPYSRFLSGVAASGDPRNRAVFLMTFSTAAGLVTPWLMINAAIWVRYARWVNGTGWTYTGQWAQEFTQDDAYSQTCTF